MYSHVKLREAGAKAPPAEVKGVPELGPRLGEKAPLMAAKGVMARTNSSGAVNGPAKV